MQKITPFLWFNDNAEEAVNFYASVFPDAKIGKISRYPEDSGGPVGQVMVVEFQLFGQNFRALNAGPHFKFTPAISFMVNCETQEEIDYYWGKLTEGGKEVDCGWLEDKYGLSWQITPSVLLEKFLIDPDKQKSARAMQAMMTMKKLDIAALQRAYNGA